MKRVFDFVATLFILTLLSPLLLLLLQVVWLNLGSPAVFRQARPGRGGRLFALYKFRTMADRRGHDGALLPDEQRLSAFGRFLRRSSLDELPELINVLKGEMSLVGPRPLLVEYLPLYSREQARRHEVRPGITGWAQVNGRNALSREETFALDVWYVDNKSFMLDVKILFMTLLQVLTLKKIGQEGRATRDRFAGTTGTS